MSHQFPFLKAHRCSATSKRTKQPCQGPAVRGWTVCRFHGAHGGAPATTGHFTKEATAARREVRELIRECRDQLRTME